MKVLKFCNISTKKIVKLFSWHYSEFFMTSVFSEEIFETASDFAQPMYYLSVQIHFVQTRFDTC